MNYPIWFGGAGSSDELPRGVPRRHTPDRRPQAASALAEPDAAMVAQVRAGNIAAFETLFRDLYPSLVRFAQTCGLSADEGDDVVVDVFAGVWDARDSWSPTRSVAAYLFRAIRNRAMNVVRDAQVAARYVAAATHETDAPLMGAAPHAPDRVMEAQERTAGLWEAVAQLPERQRVLLTLRWRDALSIDEIAAVLGLSPGATKTALTRAARALRTVLPDDFL